VASGVRRYLQKDGMTFLFSSLCVLRGGCSPVRTVWIPADRKIALFNMNEKNIC
jgi:hypothetical protein